MSYGTVSGSIAFGFVGFGVFAKSYNAHSAGPNVRKGSMAVTGVFRARVARSASKVRKAVHWLSVLDRPLGVADRTPFRRKAQARVVARRLLRYRLRQFCAGER